jgi:hypothetical protein
MQTVAQADYSIPHCQFEQKPDGGFVTSFTRQANPPSPAFVTLGILGGLIMAIIGAVRGGGPLGFIVISGATIAFVVFVSTQKTTTRIEVDPDFVTIDGKQMPRGDFGSFSQYESTTVQYEKVAVTYHQLGYQFGSRSFPCGGKWKNERELKELAAGLNRHLSQVPLRGDESRASPEALRAARPTDF